MNWFVWSLLSAVFAGLMAILAKMGVAGVNSNLATAIRTTVVLVFTWGIALAAISPATVVSLSRRTWIFLTLSGLATGLSWLCYFRALPMGEASGVAPVDKLSGVFAIALAALILREHLTWHQWLGGGLVLIHCYGGADRSGLVSALYLYAIEHQKPVAADKELSIWYGHVPLIRPKVIAMDDSFWRYVTNDAHQISLETSSK